MNKIVNPAHLRKPLGWNGRTLKEMLEESERLVAESGHYHGLEKLVLQAERPILYEKIFSRLRGGLVNARSTALNISASPIVKEIDALFSNAGTEGRISPLVDYPVDAFDQVMAVNVRGVWLSLRYAMPVMQRQGGGSIVITSSIAGLRGFAGLTAYATSKHAVVGLMRCAALEGAKHGIRVNTIHPSPIETRMMRAIEEGAAPGAADQAKDAFISMIPAGRYGTPEEVARVALFLASDDSAFCSGALVSVDGAMSAG